MKNQDEPSIDPAVAGAPSADVITGERDRVPLWLAAVVLLLLLAVIVVGGLVLREVLTTGPVASPKDRDVARWTQAVKADPDDPLAHTALGLALVRADRADEALESFDAAAELDPQNIAALFNRGALLLEAGEGEDAEESLLAVLAIDPTHSRAALVLGQYYIDEGEYAAALEVLEPAMSSNQAADLHYLAGLAHENLGDVSAAAEQYLAALAYYPDMQEAQDGLDRVGVGQ